MRRVTSLIWVLSEPAIHHSLPQEILHLASRHGQTDCVRLILDAVVSGHLASAVAEQARLPSVLLFCKESCSEPLSHLASAELLSALDHSCLDRKSAPSISLISSLSSQEKKDAALLSAASNGHLDCMKVLVERGACVTCTEEYDERPPLLRAANGGHTECVIYLIGKGADKGVLNKVERANRLALFCWRCCRFFDALACIGAADRRIACASRTMSDAIIAPRLPLPRLAAMQRT